MTPKIINFKSLDSFPTRQKKFWYRFRYGVRGTEVRFVVFIPDRVVIIHMKMPWGYIQVSTIKNSVLKEAC